MSTSSGPIGNISGDLHFLDKSHSVQYFSLSSVNAIYIFFAKINFLVPLDHSLFIHFPKSPLLWHFTPSVIPKYTQLSALYIAPVLGGSTKVINPIRSSSYLFL